MRSAYPFGSDLLVAPIYNAQASRPAVWVTGANMNVVLNGAKDVVGLRLIPLRSEAIDTVTLNGAQLQRQDVIVWDAISPRAWTIGQTARL